MATDSMADELSDNRITISFGSLLNGRPNIGEPLARNHFFDALIERVPSRFEQFLGFLGNGSHRDGHRRVAMKALTFDSEIQANYVTLLEFPRPRDSVNNLVVDRCAEHRGIGGKPPGE